VSDATGAAHERTHIPPWVNTALALLAAPISGSAIAAIILTARSGYFSWTQPVEMLMTIGMITMMGGLMLALPVALSVGWLVHILLMRIRFSDAFTYICFGASLAMATLRIVFWEAITHTAQGEIVEIGRAHV
jgi:uncharacterized membrane protein YidH (DUF202 family)